MADLTELIRAIAELVKALQWPLVASIITYFFRDDIRGLTTRIKKGKILGVEAEFADAINELTEGTRRPPGTEVEFPEAPASEANSEEQPTGASAADQSSHVYVGGFEDQVIKLSAISPRAALMILASEIQGRLKNLVDKVALSDGAISTKFWRVLPIRDQIRYLEHTGVMDPEVASDIYNFWIVRNLAIHEGAGEDNDILRAIDSGMSILGAFNRIDALRAL
jgi:hypothetical protein